MADYRHKDRIALAYDANKKRLRCEGNLILAEVMNEALHEMTADFNAALANGQILEIGGSRAELKAFLRKAADKHLGLPTPVSRAGRASTK